MRLVIPSILIFLILLGALGTALAEKPVLLYTRYFNAEGESRYLPDKDYSIVLEKLAEAFEVRVNREEPGAESLATSDVVLISNPSHAAVEDHPAPPRFSHQMIARLVAYVENGGGLILMGNQENHNLEQETTNLLLEKFGMQFVDNYTDIKALQIPKDVPMLGGLKWAYYSGNQVQFHPTETAKPYSVVTNDLGQPLLNGTRDASGCLLATATLGKGRVVVVTDAGWITNTALEGPGIANVKIEGHHNIEIVRRLAFWAAAGGFTMDPGNGIFAGSPKRLLEDSAGEGPAWDDELGLLTSFAGDIRQFKNGRKSTFKKGAHTNGLLFDSKKRLLCCEPGQKRVTRIDRDGKLTVLTDNFEGKAYNTPNDITEDSRGRIYFSDPRYGRRDGMEIRDAKGQPIEGVYRIDPGGLVTQLITHEVDRPNGVLVSNDERWLFVADNNNNEIAGAHKLWRFAFNLEDGSIDLASRELLFDWGSGRGPDGMVQAASGILYVAAGRTKAVPPVESAAVFPGGVYAFSQDGKLLGFQPIPSDEVTNCTIGGADDSTLFVTAGGELWSIELPKK